MSPHTLPCTDKSLPGSSLGQPSLQECYDHGHEPQVCRKLELEVWKSSRRDPPPDHASRPRLLPPTRNTQRGLQLTPVLPRIQKPYSLSLRRHIKSARVSTDSSPFLHNLAAQPEELFRVSQGFAHVFLHKKEGRSLSKGGPNLFIFKLARVYNYYYIVNIPARCIICEYKMISHVLYHSHVCKGNKAPVRAVQER